MYFCHRGELLISVGEGNGPSARAAGWRDEKAETEQTFSRTGFIFPIKKCARTHGVDRHVGVDANPKEKRSSSVDIDDVGVAVGGVLLALLVVTVFLWQYFAFLD